MSHLIFRGYILGFGYHKKNCSCIVSNQLLPKFKHLVYMISCKGDFPDVILQWRSWSCGLLFAFYALTLQEDGSDVAYRGLGNQCLNNKVQMKHPVHGQILLLSFYIARKEVKCVWGEGGWIFTCQEL